MNAEKPATKQETVASLFQDALAYDVPYMAYWIYYAWKNGKIALEDPKEKMKKIELPPEEYQEFLDMKRRDVLKMRPVKLYAIRRNNNLYDFYFAKTARDAADLHFRLFGQQVRKVIDAYDKMMDKEIYNEETKKVKSFREICKETLHFPIYVCTLFQSTHPM